VTDVVKAKPLYYFDQPLAVCLLVGENGEVVARGIAICSVRDSFARRLGRELASKRAAHAWMAEKSEGPIAPRWGLDAGWPLKVAFETFKRGKNGQQTAYKAEYMPVLTPRERKIVNAWLKRAGASVV